jgi:hypothetical protein
MPKFCHNCGAALAEPGAFCSACGSPTGRADVPTAPAIQQGFTPGRPSKSAWFLEELSRLGRFVVYGVLLLMLFVLWVSSRNNTPTPSSSEEPISVEGPSTRQASTESAPSATHRIGEDFSIGYWSYRCNSATWQSMIPSLGRGEVPDAEFLIVDLYIRNSDRTASTLPPVKLVDALGREYDESSKGTFMSGTFDTFKQLNPGVSSRGYVVFDVPHGQYSLQVSGGFQSGERALVDLSSPDQNDDATGKPSPAATQLTNAETPIAGSESTNNARSASAASPLPQLQFEAGDRLFIRVSSISRQPDGSFTFRGNLLQPATLSDGVLLDQSTELAGLGETKGGHLIASVTGLTVQGESYELRQSAKAANKQLGSGPAIELTPGKLIEMWFAAVSAYEKTSGNAGEH